MNKYTGKEIEFNINNNDIVVTEMESTNMKEKFQFTLEEWEKHYENRDELINLVKKNGMLLETLEDIAKDDDVLVLYAVCNNPLAIQFASPKCQRQSTRCWRSCVS